MKKKLAIALIIGLVWTVLLPFIFFYLFLTGIDSSSWISRIISHTILLPMALPIELNTPNIPYLGEIESFVIAEVITLAFVFKPKIMTILLGVSIALFVISLLITNISLSGLKTYTNTRYGYSLQYPASATVELGDQKNGYSVLFTTPNGETGYPSLYISVMPDTYDPAIYDFIPTTGRDAFIKLPVGNTSYWLMPPDNQPWSTFKKLENTTIADQQATVIDNKSVYLNGGDLKERRAFFRKGKYTYELGTYYKTPEDLKKFDQFTKNFSLCKIAFFVCIK